MKQIKVQLKNFDYSIYVGSGLITDSNFFRDAIKPKLIGSKVCVLTNETVRDLYGELVLSLFTDFDVFFFEMQDGEEFKSLASYQSIIDFLIEKGFDRDLNLVALGGGVVGDLCGFVSATYLRGVNFIQIPTTLLAQVDSSVGGKTGVNHAAGKNLIGAFYQPSLVVIDPEVLNSLPRREYLAGLAEVVKYGLIYDEAFFSWIESNSNALVSGEIGKISEAIARSCEFKSKIVSIDERESGLRAILNFGHTFGHAIETVSGYGTWLHGEAVSIGMAMACSLSSQLGMLNRETEERIIESLKNLGLPIKATNLASDHIGQLMSTIRLDKKVKDGLLRFILISEIGRVSIKSEVSEKSLEALFAQSLEN
jgi:3-dehydroquinate synthase